MSNNFLSQEEINALLSGEALAEENNMESSNSEEDTITDIDKDLLGEIGNISMGSASTALYQLINQPVNITTPVVSVTTLREIKESFETPNVVVDVEYIEGIVGRNIFIIETKDGLVISNLMMGGDGIVSNPAGELSELEISAVAEAMNQMIGSAATSMATMFGRKVDISPPTAKLVTDSTEAISDTIEEDESIVRVSFKMTIGDLVDSYIMQVFPIKTAKNIVAIMTGEEEKPQEEPVQNKEIDTSMIGSVAPQNQVNEQVAQMQHEPQAQAQMQQPMQQFAQPQMQQPMQQQYGQPQMQYAQPMQPQMQYAQPMQYQQPQMQYAQQVEVHNAAFEPLVPQNNVPPIKNMDLIMDVPLDISVVLGRARKSIQEILDLGAGSLIELDKLAEEPVEILVNGKAIALGEVVVVDENFGVRITSIVSDSEKLKSLKR